MFVSGNSDLSGVMCGQHHRKPPILNGTKALTLTVSVNEAKPRDHKYGAVAGTFTHIHY